MKATRRLQRRTNMATVLRDCVSSPRTLSELAESTSITRPAVESVVADLVDLGWLGTTAPPTDTQTLGRPATYYGLSSGSGHILSIDIGAHHVSSAVANLAGHVVAESKITVDEGLSMEERVKTAISLAQPLTHGKTPIHVATVGTPGIHHDGKVVYYGGAGMPGLQGYDLAAVISHELGTHVVTAGDCPLGARGESWSGAAAGFDDVVFILAGRRTGAASVINGRVHAGLAGSAGLIGELPALHWRDIEDETFAYRQYGDTQPDREELFAAARAGDTKALAAITDYATVLAQGTAAMVLAIAPQVVVVGGQFSEHADLFLPALEDQLSQICPFMPQVLPSQLGSRAVLLGGVRFALDSVFDRISHCVAHSSYFPAPRAVF